MSDQQAPEQNDAQFQLTILEYLERLPEELCNRLYLKPTSCLAVFRLLTTVSKQIIMSILYIETPISKSDIQLLAKPRKIKFLLENLDSLKKLFILLEKDDKIYINKTFQKQFINSLTGGGNRGSFNDIMDPSSQESIQINDLDQYAGEKWESVLHFMVGTATKKTQPNKSVLQLLKKSGLMSNTDNQPQITSKGFQFLLQDICTQIWMVLLQYLYMREEEEVDIITILGLFFQVGSLEFGNNYSVENLTDLELSVLKDLQELGFIYKKRGGMSVIIPTRLVTILTGASISAVKATMSFLNKRSTGILGSSDQPLIHSSENFEDKNTDSGFIIIETNYRLYAYTDSILQISILDLFTHLVYRFPNLVVGSITRDSIRMALQKGITADQIVAYLNTHAHPQIKDKIPPVPISISDQIRLWEKEKNRINPFPSFMYHEFNRQQDFDIVHRYAEQLGVVLWVNEKIRTMVITQEGHESVKNFVKRRMASKTGQPAIQHAQ
ncbi:hypothetical protein BB559_006531 [Furculomyces boomerangus]|uniref:RNA polymerase II transcription factor B subunit 2 n=2 Tax=Harpellales TaxID=61421 RepID=A0A2T9Y245_9FUNG|nr:hypothetical protein BB559_006531 [Furculomyces boomerangus]PVZ99390.1 hypothetical protein BB558_004599 [Smittium angustum]